MYGCFLRNNAPASTFPLTTPAVIEYRLDFKDRRGRDDDNWCSPCMKPFRDGLTQSGIIADDSIKHLSEGQHKLREGSQDGVQIFLTW